MGTNQNGKNPMGVCEKIYSAIRISPTFRRIHRISHCPKNSNTTTNASTSPLLTTEQVVIPIEFVPTVRPTSLHQNSGQMAKVDPTTKPAPNSASLKEDKVNTKAKKISEPSKIFGWQEHNQVAKLAPNSEVLVPTRVAVLEKTKPGADTARPEKAVVGTGHGQVVSKGTLKLAPESTVLSTQEQGDVNDKFSDYIHRAKMKIRATSNVGDEKSARRHDSFNDRVSNYINRAKIKIRTTTNLGEGKNISSK